MSLLTDPLADSKDAARAVQRQADLANKLPDDVSQTVRLDELVPPPGRPAADPDKLKAQGPFDPDKMIDNLEVEKDCNGTLYLMEGMTTKANAERSGITHLPANVYERK